MPKEFSIPRKYRSELIGEIKKKRGADDNRKIDLSPTLIDLGAVRFKLARFFGFCYGVENAIEIAYRAVEDNPGKRVFLLSEMIHNPHVNEDLKRCGVDFLMTTSGEELIPLSELRPDDVVIIPAFGTTLETLKKLREQGVSELIHNATCPFVEKVWKRGSQLGQKNFTVVIHGKHTHEETRATFSHIRIDAPSVVIRDRKEALTLCEFIRGERDTEIFKEVFAGRASDGFDPLKDLERLGVVNQTTMLAEETHEISLLVREALISRYGEENIDKHFGDTRDTLCYATSENQRAMKNLVEDGGDLALVVGGYNSSNTSHLVEICEGKLPVYYIKDASEIETLDKIRHMDLTKHEVVTTHNWFPMNSDRPITILLSAGASSPDAMVESVMAKVSKLLELELKPIGK